MCLLIERISSIFLAFVVEFEGKYSLVVSDKLKKDFHQV